MAAAIADHMGTSAPGLHPASQSRRESPESGKSDY